MPTPFLPPLSDASSPSWSEAIWPVVWPMLGGARRALANWLPLRIAPGCQCLQQWGWLFGLMGSGRSAV